ncbi:MAG TPA: MlaD family protein [Saprospiraceae bacterium]|nr:MlaD family protein [Saprospiraceae bacterium]
MSKEAVNYFRLGLFVIIGLALFTIGLYNIGSKRNIFGSSIQVSTVFSNVKGLKQGNNVRYSGINIGSVKNIEVINDTTLQVQMLLQRRVLDFLKKDAVASIGTDGLVGNMIVNISPGEGKGALIEDGDTLDSYSSLETEEMLNALGSTTDNIALLTLELLELIEKVNTGEGSLSMMVNDKDMAENLMATSQSLRMTSAHLEKLSVQMQNSIEKMSKGKGVWGYLSRDTTFEHDMQSITAGLDSLVNRRTEPILSNLLVSSENLAATTAQVNEIVESIDLESGLLGTVMNDSIVVRNFKNTLENLDESMMKLNENMEAVQHNFLFRRYFKKQHSKELSE